MPILPKDKAQIGIVLRKTTLQRIKDRSGMLDMKPASFAARIIEAWENEGAPPITPADKAICILSQAKMQMTAPTIRRAS